MKISDLLAQARSQLENAGVSNSKLDALVLLTHALSVSKEQIIFYPDKIISDESSEKFFALIKRRCNREPVSQIIGNREFYGHDFLVTQDTLDPRADSESLIELVIKKFPDKSTALRILEIGTGTGCLIITILKLYTNATAQGLDISEKALEIFKKNAKNHRLENRLEITKSDLFTALNPNSKFDLIISNPPYIPSAEINSLQAEVKNFEPHLALDGGLDGLDFYRKIAKKAHSFLTPKGRVILEIGFGQESEVIKIFTNENFTFEETKNDLAGIARALSFSINF